MSVVWTFSLASIQLSPSFGVYTAESDEKGIFFRKHSVFSATQKEKRKQGEHPILELDKTQKVKRNELEGDKKAS